MWNLKKQTKYANEFIYRMEIDWQTQETHLWLPKGIKGRDKLGVCD